jgi:hypothetical protein
MKKGFVELVTEQKSRTKTDLLQFGIPEVVAEKLSDFYTEVNWYASILEDIGIPVPVLDKLIVQMYKEFMDENEDARAEISKIRNDKETLKKYISTVMDSIKDSMVSRIDTVKVEPESKDTALSTEKIEPTKRVLH